MIRFPVVDSALEGFRVTRERPGAVAVWAAVLFVAYLLLVLGLVLLGIGPLMGAREPFQAPSPELAARIEQVGMWLPGWFAVFLGVNVVLYTAVLRAVLEPADARFGYLRLGRQELRQLGLWGYAILAFMALQLLLLSVQAAGASLAEGLAPGAGRVLQAALAAATFLAVLYPLLRLSIAPAATFAERRITLFAAWPLTSGQFWGMFACYGIALLLALAVMLLVTVVVLPMAFAVEVATGAGPVLLQQLGRLDLSSVQAVLGAESLVSLALNAVLSSLLLAIVVAPAPVIYRTLADRPRPGPVRSE